MEQRQIELQTCIFFLLVNRTHAVRLKASEVNEQLGPKRLPDHRGGGGAKPFSQPRRGLFNFAFLGIPTMKDTVYQGWVLSCASYWFKRLLTGGSRPNGALAKYKSCKSQQSRYFVRWRWMSFAISLSTAYFAGACGCAVIYHFLSPRLLASTSLSLHCAHRWLMYKVVSAERRFMSSDEGYM